MNYPRQWLQDRFFKGLLATMSLKGHQAVETFEGEHQRRFDRVAKRLAEMQEEAQDDSLERLPEWFVQSPITGVYKDLDEALIGLQNGMLRAQNPYYVSVALSCPPE